MSRRKSLPITLLIFCLTIVCGQLRAQDYVDTASLGSDNEFDTTVSFLQGHPYSRFDSITYSSLSVVEPSKLADSAVQKLRADPDYWYAQELPPHVKKNISQEESKGEANMPLWIWYIIAALFLGAITWYLSLSDIRLFRKKDEVIDEDEPLTENIFELDYKSAIDKAKNEEDWRMAIRLLYLHALRQLSDYGRIDYKQDKTNSAYLRELKGSDLYNSFERITRDFEFTWYGKFPLSAQQFVRVENDFDTLQNKLRA